ncbi:MAG: hypothetical protein AAGK78_10250, partial [Planctomycetota bacterium]
RGDEFGRAGLQGKPAGIWAVRASRAIVLGLIGVLLANAAWSSAAVVRKTRDDGIGYNQPAVLESPTIEHLRHLPPDTIIYSNAADIVRHALERPARYIPAAKDRRFYDDRRPNPNLEAEVAKLEAAIDDGGGVIVFFHFNRRWWISRERDIAEIRPMLPLLKHKRDGSIYVLLDTPRQKEWQDWAAERREALEASEESSAN